MQNEIHRIIHGNASNATPMNPYAITEDDAVKVEFRNLFMLVNQLFLVPGFQPMLSSDLIVLEGLLKYGTPQLASYPKLDKLTEHKYPFEGLFQYFRSLSEHLVRFNMSFKPLPPANLTNCI